MARGMVIVAALRAGLGVAAWPHAHIHGIERLAVSQRVTGDQVAYRVVRDPTVRQGRIQTAPAAPVGWGEAQMGRGERRPGGQEGIRELEERVRTVPEAAVEARAKLTERLKRQ